jgi:hypothetical protein
MAVEAGAVKKALFLPQKGQKTAFFGTGAWMAPPKRCLAQHHNLKDFETVLQLF